MTLRDALAAALRRRNPPLPLDEQFVSDADSILSDPAFREALVEAVAEALAGGTDRMAITESIYDPGTSALDVADEWYMTPRELARDIVAEMLP